MSSSNSSQALPFRSKKPLKSIEKSKDAIPEDLDPMSMKTPEKPLQLPRRSRNRNVALSLTEVRKAAERLREPRDRVGDRTDQIVSARRKIVDFPELGDASSAKPKSRSSGGNKLPEKCEILSEFFNSLDNSIRLLRLKGSSPSFTNICPKIECFTDRRFTLSHLAQMKFILPEVIKLKRTLVFDERTSCMKPELHITMNIDALDDSVELKSEGGNIFLRRVFRSRLLEFTKTHTEDQEIPEAALPDPFNIRKQSIQSDPKVNAPSLPKKSPKPKILQPVVASHFPSTFQRCFSQKKPKSIEVENSSTELSDLPAAHSIEEPSPDHVFESVNATPRKEVLAHKKEEASPSVHNTPAKLVLTPAKLMAATPGLCPPKRSYMSPESDSLNSPNKLVRRPPRTRSLKFDSPVKNSKVGLEELDLNDGSIDEEMLDILPKNLLQSIKEKEIIAMEERDPAISQAKRRRHMIACLPKIFNMIHFMFQSISRCVITKEELIHKIISGHSDIVDRREVEEQLSLLVELVPDWISEKLGSGGDLLLRINKMTSPEVIRSRLAEAE